MKHVALSLLLIVVLSLFITACIAAPVPEPTAASTAEPADKPEVVTSFDAERGELPEGIAIDKAGNTYVSLGPPLFVGGGFGEIWKISPDGATTTLAQFEGGPPAAGLAVDADDNLYYAYPSGEEDTQGVYRLTPDGETERLPGTEAIILANGITFDNDGNLFVGDSIPGAIWRIPPGGSAELWLQDDLLAGCLPDDPFGANGVAVGDGNIYVANTGKGNLVSVPILADGSAGEPELVAGAGDCDVEVKELYGMDGIVLDAEGNVYAMLVLQNKLVKIDPSDGSFSTLLTGDDGLHNPASIVFGIGEGNEESIFFTNYAVLPPVPPASPGPAVLKLDVGVQGLQLPFVHLENRSIESANEETNMVNNQVQYMVEWTVNDGALETVKQMTAAAVEAVEANEPKMMAFHWYVNEKQSKFYLLEWFEDADAIVDHFDNIGESLGELMNYAQITRYQIYGDLTDNAEDAVNALGAEKFAHFGGFTRQNGYSQTQEETHNQTTAHSQDRNGNQVQYIVEWSVNEGALDAVKQMAAESVKAVEANEPKMMAFHWYINEGQNKLYLVEWFEDADAIIEHFANIGKSIGELMNYAQITRYEVFGDLTDESRQAVEGLGAQTLGYWAGFTR